jgi:hypothetical protein
VEAMAEYRQADRSFPARPFMAGVVIVCLAIAASAVYGYVTLLQLRTDFLESRALDLVSVIDSQTRGRGRGGRSDPSVWQPALEEALASQGEVIAFIQVVSPVGELVASVGEQQPDHYVIDRQMAAPRQAGRGVGQGATSERHIRVGFYPSSVAFITRAANAQVTVAAIAILTLLVVAGFSLRTLRGYQTTYLDRVDPPAYATLWQHECGAPIEQDAASMSASHAVSMGTVRTAGWSSGGLGTLMVRSPSL